MAKSKWEELSELFFPGRGVIFITDNHEPKMAVVINVVQDIEDEGYVFRVELEYQNHRGEVILASPLAERVGILP